jgi:preprotein translocase subunit SecG
VLRIAVFTVIVFVLSAPLALAAEGNDGGEGLYGPTDDKVVTNTGFILIVGFPILILILTLIQSALERRKDRRTAAAKARKQRADLRGGW